jgi:hypothetical protein
LPPKPDFAHDGAAMRRVTDTESIYAIGIAVSAIGGLLDLLESPHAGTDDERAAAMDKVRRDLLEQAATIVFHLDQFIPLRKTKRRAQELVDWCKQPIGPQLSRDDFVQEVRKSRDHFVSVLHGDLREADLYFASPKGRFNMGDMVDEGPYLDDELRKGLAETAKIDLLEAGTCLAFGRATAVGFHLFRAMESLIVAYLDLFKIAIDENGSADRSRSWGRYIPKLEQAGVAPKITKVLTFIKDEYRNPLTHPRATLTLDQAIHLMPLAMSAIDSMARDLLKRRGASPFRDAFEQH